MPLSKNEPESADSDLYLEEFFENNDSLLMSAAPAAPILNENDQSGLLFEAERRRKTI